MGLRRRERDATKDAVISRDVSRYIVARGPEDVPQGGGNAGGGRELADSYAAIYGTTQSDNAVQDTERWADRGDEDEATGARSLRGYQS